MSFSLLKKKKTMPFSKSSRYNIYFLTTVLVSYFSITNFTPDPFEKKNN